MRVEGAKVLASLTRTLGSLDRAEDAVQDATVQALVRWPVDGVPRNPAAWLTTTARNAAFDRIRREAGRGAKEEAAMGLIAHDADQGSPEPSAVRDDQLRLLFTCCHPALAPEARVALALRTLCGLSTSEIARAFLVPEPTMAQRLVRAKRKIERARIPYRVPLDHELPDRLPAVLSVVYVVFTEAHASRSPDGLVRVDLADEAIRLARLLVDLMPDVPECAGLLALLLATHARRTTRTGDDGSVVLLADADRSRWDQGMVGEADEILRRALARRDPGTYQIQAAISLLHSRAPSAVETDWAQIADLYAALEELTGSSVVRLNRAVAVAEAQGPEAGLALLVGLDDLDGWHRFHAVRGELLARAGSPNEAVEALRVALACEPPSAEAAHVRERIAALGC